MPEIAIGGVVAIFVALAVAVLILGAPAFVRFFDATVGRLPVVGGAAASVVRAALQVATSGLRLWGDEQVTPLANLLWAVAAAPWHLLNQLADTTAALVSMGGRLAARITATGLAAIHAAQHLYNLSAAALSSVVVHLKSLIATEVANAQRLAAAATLAVLHAAQHLYNLAIADAARVEAAAFAKADAVAAAAASALAKEAAGAKSYIDHQLGAVAAGVSAEMATLEGDIAGAVSAATAAAAVAAAGAAGAAVDAIDRAAHDVVIGPWSVLLPEVEAIAVGLGVDVASAIPGLGDLTGTVPESLAGVLALLVPALAAVATEVARCGVPLCENLSGLSQVLGSLAQEATMVALFGAVAYAVADPTGAAADTDRVLGPAVGGIAHGLTSLIGDL